MAKGKKTGGRVSGSKNKLSREMKNRFHEVLEQIGTKFPEYDPLLVFAQMANDQDLEPTIRLQANKELANYLYPKRKSIEGKLEQDKKINLIFKTYELPNQ